MSTEKSENIPFSPILIMEFIRQVTINRFLYSTEEDFAVQFKISHTYYNELISFPIQAQTLHLIYSYDENNEILTVKADNDVLQQFREQKSLMEIAGQYENKYKERYQNFIKIIN